MPFFDFKCEKCGHKFNLRVSNEEKSKVKCEKCGHSPVVQMLSPFFSTVGKGSPSASPNFPAGCAGCGQAGFG